MKRTSGWLCAPAAFIAATQAEARDPLAHSVQCRSHTPAWHPTGAETASIEAVPVPERFRREEPPMECGQFSPVLGGLFEWHIGFGTERSTAAAFAYLEDKYVPRVPSPGDVEHARQAALPVLQRLGASQPSPTLYDVALRTSPPIRRLHVLTNAQRAALMLAEYAISAAEEFGSLPLVERAERLLAAAPRPDSTVPPLEQEFSGLSRLSLDTSLTEVEDMRIRAAILRARLSRSPAHLARAEALVNAAGRPVYRDLAWSAYSGGRGFCDMDLVGPADEALVANCRAHPADISERVVTWVVNRTVLDLLAATSDPDDNLDNIVRTLDLLDRESQAETYRCCPAGPRHDALRLRIASGDYYERLLERETDVYAAASHWRMALYYLRSAAESASPVDEPMRFRRIAEAWLRLWARGGSLPIEQGASRPTEAPELQRYAAYLRHLLQSLPVIAVGEH